jgi:HEAT repeat protein
MALTRKRTTEAQGDHAARAHERDVEGLLRALDDANAATRRWAARDLSSHAQATGALLARLAVEPDASVRQTLLTSLAILGSEDVVRGLIEFLRSDDAALRNETVEAMKNMPAAVAAFMPQLLADPDVDVRIFAINVLESLRHPQVESWLIEVIARDANVNVCATAVDLLGEVGTVAAELALEALKQRFAEEPYIAFAADLALRRVREG